MQTFSRVHVSDEIGRTVEATALVAPGTLLGVYPGTRLNLQDFHDKEAFVSRSIKYAFKLSDGLVLDPTDPFGYLPNRPELRLALINEPPEGIDVNTLSVPSKNHVWYLTIKAIQPGARFYTTYGPSYKREYKTEMNQSSGYIEMTEEIRLVLKTAALSYPWLQASIASLLEERL